MPTTVTVTGPILGPDGDTPVTGGTIHFTRSHEVRLSGTGVSAPEPADASIGPDGEFSVDLLANDSGEPSGTTYTVEVNAHGGWQAKWQIQVMEADAPTVSLADLEPVGGVQIGPSRFDDLESEVEGHALASTGVHGVEDMAVLATQDDVADAVSRLWLPATAFLVQAGSPILTRVGVTPIWQMPGAATAVLNATCLAADWATVDVFAWGFNVGAGSGDIVVRMFSADHTAGGDASTATGGSTTTATALAQNVAHRVKMTPASLSVTAHTPLGLQFRRTGGDASDTLTGDWAFMGYEVVSV